MKDIRSRLNKLHRDFESRFASDLHKVLCYFWIWLFLAILINIFLWAWDIFLLKLIGSILMYFVLWFGTEYWRCPKCGLPLLDMGLQSQKYCRHCGCDLTRHSNADKHDEN